MKKTLIISTIILIIVVLELVFWFLNQNNNHDSKRNTSEKIVLQVQNNDSEENIFDEKTSLPTKAKLYSLINSHRESNKLSKLRIQPLLEKSANQKLSAMIEEKYWRHTDKENKPPWQFFRNVGYQYKNAGENLSFGNNTSWQVFKGWLESPQHNDQLLFADYREMGIAINCESYNDYSSETCLVVLHLGNK